MTQNIKSLHRKMQSWCNRMQAKGWKNPEVERAATRVRMGLWACAHNDPPHHTLVQGLAEDTAALERALGR
jgi:hypothetical protein